MYDQVDLEVVRVRSTHVRKYPRYGHQTCEWCANWWELQILPYNYFTSTLDQFLILLAHGRTNLYYGFSTSTNTTFLVRVRIFKVRLKLK